MEKMRAIRDDNGGQFVCDSCGKPISGFLIGVLECGGKCPFCENGNLKEATDE